MRPLSSRSVTLAIAILGAIAGVAGADDTADGDKATSTSLGGFSLTNLKVERSEILAGGPGRDGIRSVDQPTFSAPDVARWVRGDTPVIGVVVGEQARAYPVHVMEWHQVVNDHFDGALIVVTYDPLTDIAGAWKAKPQDEAGTFGVSGLIYQAGFLVYDRGSDSLWSPVDGRAIAGPRAGERLGRIAVRVEPMARWFEREPGTVVLDLPERKEIDYRRSPYEAYWTSLKVPFPVAHSDDRFHPKEVVLGVRRGAESRAYVGSILTRAGGKIVDEFGGRRIRVAYDGETGTFSYDAPADVEVSSAYWFAWKNLHPDTGIWREDLAQAGEANSEE